MSLHIVKKEGKEPSLELDKRSITSPLNAIKNLRQASNLPIECNGCIYRSKESGGNGICKQYEKDSLCRIRKDIKKIIDKYGNSNTGQVLPLMEEEFEANYEKLKFFEQLESYKGYLDPEVTKRINVLNNLGKVINEMKTKRTTIEMSEKKTLSEDTKQEIARMLTVTKEESNP